MAEEMGKLQRGKLQRSRHANTHFDDDLQFPQQIALLDQPESDEKSHERGGVIPLLKECLECESGKSTSLLSGYVHHFQCIALEDVGWGCGWRNIQMLASHLLVHSQEARQVLFGGAGFVPDIPALQRWLEIAWEKGFDAPGAMDFQQKICGKRSWIGATECAALFRSFGLRARIVDFCSSGESRVIGPMDRYLNRGDGNEMVKGHAHRLLADWVWSYFSDNKLSKSGGKRVVVTDKTPLYFQQDGHSRSIVGIQVKDLPNGMHQYNLLILDPAHNTKAVESCLRKKVGWQRFIKRGVHTLKKMEYQLCYVDPGIATASEIERLKTLDSTRFQF